MSRLDVSCGNQPSQPHRAIEVTERTVRPIFWRRSILWDDAERRSERCIYFRRVADGPGDSNSRVGQGEAAEKVPKTWLPHGRGSATHKMREADSEPRASKRFSELFSRLCQ